MNKKIIKILSIVYCILIVVSLSGLTVWQYNEYLENKEKYEAKKQDMQELKDEIEEIKRMLSSYEKEKEEFAKYLFDERDIPAFLDELSKHANEESVEIVDMKTQKFRRVRLPKDVEDKRARGSSKRKNNKNAEKERKRELERVLTLSAMPIKVRIDGTFHSLTKFLNHLQGYEQLINIDNIEIKLAREYPTLECRFTINIYSLKSLAELGAK